MIQNTLRRTIEERDEARDEVARVTLAMAEQTGSAPPKWAAPRT